MPENLDFLLGFRQAKSDSHQFIRFRLSLLHLDGIPNCVVFATLQRQWPHSGFVFSERRLAPFWKGLQTFNVDVNVMTLWALHIPSLRRTSLLIQNGPRVLPFVRR